MNPNTGEIREFSSRQEANKAGFTIPVGQKPKASCSKCYGRGHIGRNDQGRYLLCTCVKPIRKVT